MKNSNPNPRPAGIPIGYRSAVAPEFTYRSRSISSQMLQFLLLVFLFIITKQQLHAQSAMVLDVTNKGLLSIKSGTTVSVEGSFQNTNTANLQNNGDLYVRKDITNDQSGITPGTGLLVLNGTAVQTLYGAAPLRTYRLTTDNVAGFFLNNDLVVYDRHDFVNGMLGTPASSVYMTYEAGATYTGATDSRHVNGWVRKLGADNFIFPVGNASYLRPVTLENITAASTFAVKYGNPTPNHTQVTSPILGVNANEYWQVLRSAGTGAADITLSWDQSKVAMPFYYLTDMRATRIASGLWTNVCAGATGSVYTTGSVKMAAQSQFGSFAIGSVGFLVPLKYLKFTGERRSDYTLLNWETLYEVTAEAHEVERSDDGLHFRKIGTVAAVNGNTRHTYLYNDALPLEGTAWYRIRTVDRSGSSSYSAIISVREKGGADILIVNNPASDVIYLSPGKLINGSFNYQLVAANGQQLQQGTLSFSNGAIVPLRITQHLTQGIYILELKNGIQRFAKTVMIR